MAVQMIQNGRVGWRFWSLWMLAGFGAAVAFLAAMIPVNAIVLAFNRGGSELGRPSTTEQILISLLVSSTFALLGALIGLGQWWLMRKYLHCGWWIAAAAVGYAVPFLVGPAGWLSSFIPLPPWMGMLSMVTGLALVLGGLQALVLRNQIYQPGWWVLITLAGWALAFGLTTLFIVTGLYVEPMDMVLAYFCPIAVAGAGMVWQIRRTARRTEERRLSARSLA